MNSIFPDRAVQQFDVLDFVQHPDIPNSKPVTDPAIGSLGIEARVPTSANFGSDPHMTMTKRRRICA